MANDRDLSFNVAAIDRTAKSFEKIALRLERLEAKLDKLDRKRVEVDVDIDTDRALRQVDNFSQVSTAATAGAVRLSTSNIYVFIAVILAALATLPAAGAIAATGVALAFGAGLAGIGIAAAAQDKNIRKLFKGLVSDLGKDLKRIAKPFEGTLRTIAAVARDVYDSLNLGPIFAQLAPAVSRFARNFGQALKGLAPALGPLSDAFTRIMDRLGPMLVPLFTSIGEELTKLADVVNDNADAFAGLVGFLLASIPIALKIVTALAKAFAWLYRNAPKFASVVISGFTVAIKATQAFTQAILSTFGLIIDGAVAAFGWIPGIGDKLKGAQAKFKEFEAGVNSHFDKVIDKAGQWKDSLDKTAKAIEIKGDISDLEGKIAKAKRKLKDPDLTKAQRKQIKGDIRDLERKLATAKGKLAELKPPTIKQVKGNIRHLEGRLSVAKRKLKDPTLTKAQTKRIKGNIRDLERKVNRAKRKLAQLRDKTVTVRMNVVGANLPSSVSIPGHRVRAHGGDVRRGRSYLVGEHGPELFTATQTGRITPNSKLDGAAGSSGGIFEGTLVLDSGQFLGVVRGEIRESDRDKKQRALAGAGANR